MRELAVTHQQVVTDAIGKLCQRVCIQRCHQHQVSPAPELDVQHRVRAPLPQLPFIFITVEGDRNLLDVVEVLCSLSGDHLHFEPGDLQQLSDEKGQLEGSHTPSHTHQDAVVSLRQGAALPCRNP